MRLGTETASVTNYLYSRTKNQPYPELGMGATVLCWTDRHAATIVEVKTWCGDLYVRVRQDKAVRTDKNGMSEEQNYRYERNPDGREYSFRRRNPAELWQCVEPGKRADRWKKVEGPGMRIGKRDEYHDFSF